MVLSFWWAKLKPNLSAHITEILQKGRSKNDVKIFDIRRRGIRLEILDIVVRVVLRVRMNSDYRLCVPQTTNLSKNHKDKYF